MENPKELSAVMVRSVMVVAIISLPLSRRASPEIDS